jgi:hypothetical protein
MKLIQLQRCLVTLLLALSWSPSWAQDDALVEKLRGEVARLKVQLASSGGAGMCSSSSNLDGGGNDSVAFKAELLALKKVKMKLWKENLELKKSAASGSSGSGVAATATEGNGGNRHRLEEDGASAELQKQLAEVRNSN